MGLPITPLIDLVISIICIFCSYKLYTSYRDSDHKRIVLLFFAQGYFSLIFSYFCFSLPRLLVPEQSLVLGIGFVMAQAFLFVAVAFFAKVTVYFINIQWVQRVFWIVVVAAAIAVMLNVIYFNYPEYNRATGITNWNINPIVGLASTVIFAGVLVPSTIFFFRQGFQSQDKVVKTRSIVIAIGLLFLMITAYAYYTATTQFAALTSDLLSLVSFLIIFFGIFYKRGILSAKLYK